jgi:hypothetical protein
VANDLFVTIMFRSMKTRRMIIALGAGLAVLVALHPPWTARAVVMRMSFDVPAAPPATVFDTVTWVIASAPVYLRPSLGVSAQQLAGYQARISKGDTSAAREWQIRIENIERRYRVPDTLRSKWTRDTDTGGATPAVAFTRRIVTAHFEVDVVRLGVYLLAVVAATTAAAIITSRLSA